MEQAGAYIDKLRLSFAEYLQRWGAKRPEVLRWHDLRLMQYPASVAVTWETTFAQLTEPERRLAGGTVLAGPEPIPLLLFDAAPLAEAIPDPREALAGLAGYSLARFEATGDVGPGSPTGAGDHPPLAAPKPTAGVALRIALEAVNDVALGNPRTSAPGGSGRRWPPRGGGQPGTPTQAGLAEPTARLMNRLGLYWQAAASSAPPSRSTAARWRSTSGAMARTTQRRHPPQQPGARCCRPQPAGRGRAALPSALARSRAELRPRSSRASPPPSTTWRVCCEDTDRLDEAEPLYRRALAIAERSMARPPRRRLRPQQPGVAAAGHRPAGRGRAALPPRAGDRRGALGPDHPKVATALNNLAVLLRATNRLDEAEPLFRRALAIDERAYGPDHPERRHRPQQPGGLLLRHQPPGRGRAALSSGAWRSTSGATARTTPTSPPPSTTWRDCCGPPIAQARPSRSCGWQSRHSGSSARLRL